MVLQFIIDYNNAKASNSTCSILSLYLVSCFWIQTFYSVSSPSALADNLNPGYSLIEDFLCCIWARKLLHDHTDGRAIGERAHELRLSLAAFPRAVFGSIPSFSASPTWIMRLNPVHLVAVQRFSYWFEWISVIPSVSLLIRGKRRLPGLIPCLLSRFKKIHSCRNRNQRRPILPRWTAC